jgi:hypothetical protein
MSIIERLRVKAETRESIEPCDFEALLHHLQQVESAYLQIIALVGCKQESPTEELREELREKFYAERRHRKCE